MRKASGKRRVCFVTGTRAEFGLMRTALEAIRSHPRLQLQLVVTGMHLDRRHGRSLDALRSAGWRPDAVVPWPACGSPATNAAATGSAIAGLARAYHRLASEIVVVVGDRVEAFAAAAAAHISHIPLAHIHGGDRALGQVDDALRSAITRLAHLHLAATAQSARRLLRQGEESFRIHTVGSPGVDGITGLAEPWHVIAGRFPGLAPHRYALLLLHPADPDEQSEYRRAGIVLDAAIAAGFEHIVIVYPNNDHGSAGIIRRWEQAGGKRSRGSGILICKDLPRGVFLGLMRDAAVLVGNSSSGIIEAASFGTPVLDIGPRQAGRQRSRNVIHCDYGPREILGALRRVWNAGQPRRARGANVYGGDGAGRRMADILAALPLDGRLLRKLLRY